MTEEELAAAFSICDRCGEEHAMIGLSAGLETWHDWAGATLCDDCWAEVEAEERRRSERIAWQQFTLLGGWLRRNAAEQFEASLDLQAGDDQRYTLSFVFDDDGASWGWRPSNPPFVATFTEE